MNVRRIGLIALPWIAGAALLAVLLIGAEQVASWLGQRRAWTCTIIDIQHPSQLAVKLDYLRRFQGFKVVAIGDSLIYGQTMEQHGDADWREHTITARLERAIREQRPNEPVLVLNLGINGALPCDLEALAKFIVPLDVDLLVFDTHLRPFSADFAKPEEQFARPWLRELKIDPRGEIVQLPAQGTWDRQVTSACDRWLLNASALWRNRQLVQSHLWGSAWMQSGPRLRQLWTPAPSAEDATEDEELPPEFVLALQLAGRFQSIHLDPQHPQRQALERMLAYLNERGQRTIVFYSRENPEQIHDLLKPTDHARLQGELLAMIGRYTGRTIDLVPPLPTLEGEHFLDFAHLNAAGYDLLAEHLLTRITLPGELNPIRLTAQKPKEPVR